jgi:hypothetical protein
MTTDQLRTLHRAQPFQAFEIFLADGRPLCVDHRERLAISKGGRTIGVAADDNVIETVDLLLVTSLKPKRNNRSRRRGP